jgi:hypothetical protein
VVVAGRRGKTYSTSRQSKTDRSEAIRQAC